MLLVPSSLRMKSDNSELFWSAFSRIRTEYGGIRSISPYSVRMLKMRTRTTPNTDTFHAVTCPEISKEIRVLSHIIHHLRKVFLLLRKIIIKF